MSDLRAEAAWLEALARDTAIRAPRLVRTREGTAVLALQAPGVPGVWYGTLLTWLPGRLLAHALTPANLAAFGALFAQLHQHGAAWQPPADFSTRRFTAFLSRDEPDVLFSAAVLDALPPPTRDALLAARAWVEQEYARLDPGDLRVIHCDLWHENVKVHAGQLCPFDFEDTVWGFRLHDLALGLLDLLLTARKTPPAARGAVLVQADIELDRLRYTVRLCHALALLTDIQYRHLGGLLSEVGRLLGTWLKPYNTSEGPVAGAVRLSQPQSP